MDLRGETVAGTDAGSDVGKVLFEKVWVAGEGADKVLAGDGREGSCQTDVCVLLEEGERLGEGYYLEEAGA